MTYLRTVWSLGPTNVGRALLYRVLKRGGYFRWRFPRGAALPTPTFEAKGTPTRSRDERPGLVEEADALLSGKLFYFSAHLRRVGDPPDWFRSPFTDKRHSRVDAHWSDIGDFGDEAGDIKVIWELARFGWAPVLVRAWRSTGDQRYLAALQRWVADWCLRNPPNTGPNWKCGQETSFRLINLLLAAALVEDEGASPGRLAPFVVAHCRRIATTTFYAVAQDNNHGTSEGAALFIGGAWLARHGESAATQELGRIWSARGRHLLESLVPRLVLADGSFSQHSVVYHRLMLDTLSVAEAWRRRLREKSFSDLLRTRIVAATQWLGSMLVTGSGDAPNLGANDGALPFRLCTSAYRDFRPCVQLAALAFMGSPALPPGPWDEAAAWLGLAAPGRPWLEQGSRVFSAGGHIVLRAGDDGLVVVRAPTARFRPSQADALHVDLWWEQLNVLRDGGTLSYAGADAIAEELASVAGHNTVQFDDRDQMPRIGRFLYGDWVCVQGGAGVESVAATVSWAGGFQDHAGVRHERTVTLRRGELAVQDRVAGFRTRAVLRWRLAPSDWSLGENVCRSALGEVRIGSSVPIERLWLGQGWESRHYLERTPVPVLNVQIAQAPATLTTTVMRM